MFLDKNKHVPYSTSDCGRLLGISQGMARRLVQIGVIKRRDGISRHIVYGSAVLEFLDGVDKPMEWMG